MDQYAKKSSQINKMVSMPTEQLIDHLAKTHQALTQAAPNIAPHIQSIAMNGLKFLHDKMPKPNFEMPGQDNWEPSRSQKASWLHYHDAVSDPISVLDHVKNGTLSSHHLEALQAVHPELLNDMKQKVMENATPKNLKNLSYARKMAVSKFIGQPMDESLLPNVIAADQAKFAASPASQMQGKTKSTQSGLDKLNQSKMTITETQELSDEED